MIEIRELPHFSDWLSRLRDQRAKAAIAARIERLEFGNFGDVRPVGHGVSELRIDVGPGYRVYLVRRGKILIILLCGGDKGSQAKDIKLAISLAERLEE